MKKKLLNRKEVLRLWRLVRKDLVRIYKEGVWSEEKVGICRSVARVIKNEHPEFCYSSDFDDARKTMQTWMEQYRPPNAGYLNYWWNTYSESGMLIRLEVCDDIIKRLEYKK